MYQDKQRFFASTCEERRFSKQSRGSHTRRLWVGSHGFTLIELLVVVAIIAVLVAVLLPALSSARDEATKISCRSRLHSLGLVIQYYANDHNDFVWLTSNFSSWQPNAMSMIYAKYLDGGWTEYFRCPAAMAKAGYATDSLDYGGSCRIEDWSGSNGANHPVQLPKYYETVIVSDRFWSWLQPLPEHSHRTGVNLLRGDMSSQWFHDSGHYLLSLNMSNDGGFWVTCNLFDWLTTTAR
jgi:prepilin-type N-terminal cleavage/methylation domain-containing protein